MLPGLPTTAEPTIQRDASDIRVGDRHLSATFLCRRLFQGVGDKRRQHLSANVNRRLVCSVCLRHSVHHPMHSRCVHVHHHHVM